MAAIKRIETELANTDDRVQSFLSSMRAERVATLLHWRGWTAHHPEGTDRVYVEPKDALNLPDLLIIGDMNDLAGEGVFIAYSLRTLLVFGQTVHVLEID